jgi:hypothetical protein
MTRDHEDIIADALAQVVMTGRATVDLCNGLVVNIDYPKTEPEKEETDADIPGGP